MTMNPSPAGFWSYTHRDDEIEEGRIRRLASKIANEFEGITADEFDVFIDKKDIRWGDEWRKRIDSALTGSTFFMPIITPRFLKSEECRREILTFIGHAKSLGLQELLLPILYFDVPQLREPDSSDEVVALIAERQYMDWTKLRLEDEDSPAYRKEVNRLAARLVEIIEQTAEVEPPPILLPDSTDTDDEPGMLELMADAESALPGWAQVMEDFNVTVREVGERVTRANEESARSDARGGGFAGRLRIMNELSKDLKDPVDRMSQLGNDYSATIVTIDPGVLGLIRMVEEEGVTAENAEQVGNFFTVIRTAGAQNRFMVESVQEFANTLTDTSNLSKSMRPVIKKMRASLQHFMDGKAVWDEWDRRISEVSERLNLS
ncbi:toll/interleukin-1 receptor domain-containing protein [Streptomyces sp. TRM70350]|uniref:toll/interleukin-1 receptor domain-containing protein n=1 Tax=Streptomyces sp. TRM70350 TaxID=2856165 RepID=UPI001C43C26E|nr:toll/interleukin-1 receptor domain-containing protein [Streptomyces sp. TRM70350]MBV7701009.1 toll/interleukin-1 receptor domain-containing protein [Streptomyces sp. TRM70350]